MRSLRRTRALTAHASLGVLIAACIALYFLPPGQADFWPQCPIHQLFGIECPGCGTTRALAALLHGHLQQALRYNALAVIFLPFAIVGGLSTYGRALAPGSFQWPRLPAAAIYSAVASSIVFTIARNAGN